MTQFIPFSRGQAFLLPPDAKDWLPADDVAHLVVAAVERVPLGAFAVRPIPGGKPQSCRSFDLTGRLVRSAGSEAGARSHRRSAKPRPARWESPMTASTWRTPATPSR